MNMEGTMRKNIIYIGTLFITVLFFSISFGQTDWTKYEGNPIIRSIDYSWDYHLFTPFVLKEGDIYKMWYTGANTYYRIGYATSSDGITWSRNAGNPILEVGVTDSWDDRGVIGPQVIFDGSSYHMWYGGWDGTLINTDDKPLPANCRSGYATSSDGITWEKYPANPVMELGAEGSWDADGVFGASVMYKDSLFKLWYGGLNGVKGSIGYATSTDFIHWEKYSGNPVMEPGTSTEWDSLYIYFPNVLYNADSRRFEMWYAGGVKHTPRHIGFATSPDGITWEKYSNNPVMSPGPDVWDSLRFSGTHVMVTNSGYKMWYSGLGPTPSNIPDPPSRVQIGYATAPIGTAITDKNNTPTGYRLKQNYPNPFNPATTIELTLLKSENVELKVYNILGKEVSTLVAKKLNQGNHTYTFYGKHLASGVYYYRIKAGNFVETRKMIYLK